MKKSLCINPGQSCCCTRCDISPTLFIRSNFHCSKMISVLCAFVKVCQANTPTCQPAFSPISLSPGGVILYAGSSGSASPSPGSPSSGYQTQSPSSHSQPSSPEGVSFQEIGTLKQRREQGGGTPSPKMVFQFPEVNNAPVAPITTVSSANYSHPTVAKRPCGFTGTFTSKYQLVSYLPVLYTFT